MEENDDTSNILSISIADKKILYATYMPFLTNGGIFIPTKKIYKIKQAVQLMLKLPDSDTKYLISAEVAWITPEGAQNNKIAGIGVEFQGEDAAKIKNKIEALLGEMLTSNSFNHTM